MPHAVAEGKTVDDDVVRTVAIMSHHFRLVATILKREALRAWLRTVC